MAAFAGLIGFRPIESTALFGSAAFRLAIRYWMIPIVTAACDRIVKYDVASTDQVARWYRASVVLNIAEMATLLGIIGSLLQ